LERPCPQWPLDVMPDCGCAPASDEVTAYARGR